MAQKDVNGVELKVGQHVCFHSSSSPLELGVIVRLGKVLDDDWYINVFIKPFKKEKIRNCKLSRNIIILEDLMSTYL